MCIKIALLLLNLLGALNSVQSSCEDTHELVRCFSIMQKQLRADMFYSNVQELEEACRVLGNGFRCVEKHVKKCPTVLQKKDFTSLYSGWTHMINALCDNAYIKKEIMKYPACYGIQFEECKTPAIVGVLGGAPDVCDLIYRMHSCIFESARKKCKPEEAYSVCETMETLFSAYLSNLKCNNTAEAICSMGTPLQPTFVLYVVTLLLGFISLMSTKNH